MNPWVPLFEACLPRPPSPRKDVGQSQSQSPSAAASQQSQIQPSQPPPTTFTFCTVSATGVPRARTCVFRGFLFNSNRTGVLVFTTDRRMAKVDEIKANDAYEAVFYFPEHRKQFRFSGFCQLLTNSEFPPLASRVPPASPLPDAPPAGSSAAVSAATSAASRGRQSPVSASVYPVARPDYYDDRKRASTASGGQDDLEALLPAAPHAGIPPQPTDDEWKAEWRRHWEALSPSMRASFRKPPPGTLLTDASQRQLDALSRGVDGASDDDGLDNFACVLLFVNAVDVVDVHDVGRRQYFARVGLDDWTEQDVCP